MSDSNAPDVKATLNSAARAEHQTRAATRWWPRFMGVMGLLAFAHIVAIEVFFPSGVVRAGAGAVWALAMGSLLWWANAQDVHPRKANRRFLVAMAIWYGSYLFVVGPFVRWQADNSLPWWSVAAAAMASPFLISAWRERRRS